MPTVKEMAKTELTRRAAQDELARRGERAEAEEPERMPLYAPVRSFFDDEIPEYQFEDYLPVELQDEVKRYIQESDNPEETRARIINSLYYSQQLEIVPEMTFDLQDELNKMFLGKEMSPATAAERLKNRYKNGKIQVKMMDLGYDLLNQMIKNPEVYEQNIDNINQLRSQLKGDWLEDYRGFLERMIGATAEQAPIMWEALKEAPVGGAVGGLVCGLIAMGFGATAGALLPEEPVTVPLAVFQGIKIGAGIKAANRIRQLEAGGMFLELMDMEDEYGNKIDPKIAVVASHAVGFINGAIELGEWAIILSTFGISEGLFNKSVEKVTRKLLAEGTIRQVVLKHTFKYTIALSAEVLQEVEQETANIVFGELAKELNNARKGTDFKRITTEELKSRYVEITTESLRAFGLIVAPGTIISGAVEAITRKPEVKLAPEIAEKPPEPPAVEITPIEPTAVTALAKELEVSLKLTPERALIVARKKLEYEAALEAKPVPAIEPIAAGLYQETVPLSAKEAADVVSAAFLLDDGLVIKGKDTHYELVNEVPEGRKIVDAGFVDSTGKYLYRDDVIKAKPAPEVAEKVSVPTGELTERQEAKLKLGLKILQTERGKIIPLIKMAREISPEDLPTLTNDLKNIDLRIKAIQDTLAKPAPEVVEKAPVPPPEPITVEKPAIVPEAPSVVEPKPVEIEKIVSIEEKIIPLPPDLTVTERVIAMQRVRELSEEAMIVRPQELEAIGLTKKEREIAGYRIAHEMREAQKLLSRVGYKRGYAEARTKIVALKEAQKVTEETRETARDLVMKYLPKEERGAYVTRVARAKTPKALQEITEAIEKSLDKIEHRQAVSELNLTIKTIKKLYGTKGALTKKMRPEFRQQTERLLESFKVANITPETILKKSDIADFAQQVLDTAEEDSVAYIQAKEIQKGLAKQKAKTFAARLLPTESIKQITDELKWLVHENLWKEREIASGKAEELSDIQEKIDKEIVSRPIKEPKTIIEKAIHAIAKFLKVDHSNLESLLDVITGGKRGTLTESVYDIIDEGVDKQYIKAVELRDAVRKIVDPDKYLEWVKHENTVTLDGKEYVLTDNELMSIYMHSRNPHNLAVLLNDGLRDSKRKIKGITIEDVDNIINKLTNEQKDVCERIGDKVLDGLTKDAINETSLKIEGHELADVINYWPAQRYITRKILGKKPRGIQSTIEGMGLLKERVGIGKPLRLNGFFETLYSTNKRVASYYGLAAPLRDAKAILNNDALIENLQDNGYTEHLESIQEQIKRIEDNSAELDPIERFMGKLIRGMARSVFSINIKLAPRQQLSSVLIAPYIDAKYIKAFKGLSSKVWIDKIKRISPQTESRFEHHRYDRDIGTASLQHEPFEYFTGRALKRDKPLAGLRYHDTNAIVDVWRAAEAEIKDKNPELGIDSAEFEAKLKRRAEWLVKHTQPTWHIKDRSVIGSTPKPFTKSLTMFMSQREKLVMMLSNATTAYQNDNISIGKLSKVYGAVAANIMLIAAYDALFMSLVYRRRETLRDYVGRVFQYLFGLVYFGRYLAEIIRVAEAQLEGRGFTEVSAEAPPLRIITGTLNGMVNFYKAVPHLFTGEEYEAGPNKDKKKWKIEVQRGVIRSLESIAMYKGLPYTGPRQIYRAMDNWFGEEKKKPIGKIQ